MKYTNIKSATKYTSMKRKQTTNDIIAYVFLSILCLVWVLPIVLVVYTALRNESGPSSSVVPLDGFTFNNFARLFTDKVFTDSYPYLKWVGNTLIVAIFTTIISTVFVISVAYTMSRMRFKSRKKMMSINLILGMFPGFMSMIAVYNILKAIHIDGTLISLIMVYSGAAGSGFYIAKGFFDTVPKSLDEAAKIDGANSATVFFKIIFPLSKPIIVYTLLTTFTGPWVDFIFSSVLLRDKAHNWTIALGLFKLIDQVDVKAKYYTTFFAGSSLISLPIMLMFMLTQRYYVGGITDGAVKG